MITASYSLKKGNASNEINCQLFYGPLKCSLGVVGHGVSLAYMEKMLDTRDEPPERPAGGMSTCTSVLRSCIVGSANNTAVAALCKGKLSAGTRESSKVT